MANKEAFIAVSVTLSLLTPDLSVAGDIFFTLGDF
jgi:hypothetical protein